MKIGLVGYQGSGKSTFFKWITGVDPDPSLSHSTQSAMAPVPDPRIEQLCKIYEPGFIRRVDFDILKKAFGKSAIRPARCASTAKFDSIRVKVLVTVVNNFLGAGASVRRKVIRSVVGS